MFFIHTTHAYFIKQTDDNSVCIRFIAKYCAWLIDTADSILIWKKKIYSSKKVLDKQTREKVC